jgi:hypothetical protein
MFHNDYISERLQAARRRDLLEAAERSRLAAQARIPRRLSLPRLEWRRRRGTQVVEPRPCGSPATR